jgi:hypothetical protein
LSSRWSASEIANRNPLAACANRSPNYPRRIYARDGVGHVAAIRVASSRKVCDTML